MKAQVMVMLLGFLLPITAPAEVYRCQTDEGLAFQDTPCTGPGRRIELAVDRPSAEEVARTEKRLAAMQDVLTEIDEERANAARENAQRGAARQARFGRRTEAGQDDYLQPAPGDDGSQRYYSRQTGPDRRNVDTCPLGLSNCKKARNRTFRRQKRGPLLPFGGEADGAGR